MNEDNILLLSYVLEVLTLVSIVVAALVIWRSVTAKTKKARPRPRMGDSDGDGRS